MSVCTFFGHRDTPAEVETSLRAVLVDLIERKQVDRFYVGHQGAFDTMVRRQLKQLQVLYPPIRYEVVLAYLPTEQHPNAYEDFSDTVYPDCLENTPPRYAISARNKWMIDKAQYAVTYVVSPGGAAQFKTLAQKKGRTVIELADII